MQQITHPDQIARIRHRENAEVMFPLGAMQMLAYIYAVEGVPAEGKSLHAALIDKMAEGEIESFNVNGVNLRGHDALDKRAEAAILRRRVEELMSDSDACCLRAKYGCSTSRTTQLAVCVAAVHIWAHFSRNRNTKAQRSTEYVTRVLWYETCVPENKRDGEVCKIIGDYGVSPATFYRDVAMMKRYLWRRLDVIMDRVTAIFGGTEVLP